MPKKQIQSRKIKKTKNIKTRRVDPQRIKTVKTAFGLKIRY